ncbi:MAG: hypothetical protein JSV43_08210 [Methanobacteriota archaeon]|nr:MAG: hypothetical protein JSV43_08210 [Euryarchaeota archaeon]
MPINESRIEKMKELGLTEYQARVYLTLLDLGLSKASKIPSISRVPRTRIYSTMSQLHEKGLVEIIPESPIKYRPVPISDYLDKVAESYKRTASEIASKKEELEQEFAVMGEVETEETGRFEAIYGRRNVRERLTRMYEESESEILSIGTSMSPIRIVRSRLPTIEEKFKLGVDMKYAFPICSTNSENAQMLSQYADVKNIDLKLSMYFLVVDSKQALLCHPIPPDESFLKGDDIAIWTDDEGMAEALRNIATSILEQGYDIESLDFATPLLDSAKSYIGLLGIKTKPIFETLATSIGSELSDQFKSDNPVDLMNEMSEYWEANSLGELTILKKKPLTIQISQFVKCNMIPHKSEDAFCDFVQRMVGSLVEKRLKGKASLSKKKCLGKEEGYCRVSFVVA